MAADQTEPFEALAENTLCLPVHRIFIILFTDFLNRTAAYVLELLRGTNRVSGKNKSGHPATTLTNHTIRQYVAVVPYMIDFAGHSTQKGYMAIFDPDLENFDAC